MRSDSVHPRRGARHATQWLTIGLAALMVLVGCKTDKGSGPDFAPLTGIFVLRSIDGEELPARVHWQTVFPMDVVADTVRLLADARLRHFIRTTEPDDPETGALSMDILTAYRRVSADSIAFGPPGPADAGATLRNDTLWVYPGLLPPFGEFGGSLWLYVRVPEGR